MPCLSLSVTAPDVASIPAALRNAIFLIGQGITSGTVEITPGVSLQFDVSGYGTATIGETFEALRAIAGDAFDDYPSPKGER